MGAFFLVRAGEPASTARVLAAAKTHFERVGFRHIVPVELGVYAGLVCGTLSGTPPMTHAAAIGQAVAAGAPFCGTAFGSAALARLVEATPLNARPGAGEISGHYAVALAKQGAAWLFGDELGIFPIYHDAELRVLSTSLQAALLAIEHPTLSVQAAYELVHHGAVLGDETVVNEVRMLSPRAVVKLTEPPAIIPGAPIAVPTIEEGDLDNHVNRCLAAARASVSHAVAAFGDNIEVPLSGGYDSRLLLGLLQEQGSRPHVYVYGKPGDADVRIAEIVARGEGFALECCDKRTLSQVTPDSFPTVVETNFLRHDIPHYDGYFDAGGHDVAHQRRAAGGALSVSGGGGEVFRNFFYLRNTVFTIRELLWCFYSQFDPSICTARFDLSSFYRAMAAKVRQILGVTEDRLARNAVEILYPSLRCRAWFGSESAYLNRYGAWFYPFIEIPVVKVAGGVPLRLKDHGRLESHLIRRAAPSLARYPTDYGHDFDSDPPLRRRLSDWLTYVRPTLLRRYSYRVQQHLAPRQPVRQGLLADEYLGRVIDPGCPIMSRYFRLDQVRDRDRLQRIYSLEYFVTKLAIAA